MTSRIAPITIGIHSYKGGTGKSLLGAHFASFLQLIGKNCVIVDCDVEAPSIHFKFQRAFYAPGRGGLVGYLSHSINQVPRPIANLMTMDAFTYTLPRPKKYSAAAPLWSDRLGEIRVVGAGDLHTIEYWRTIWGQSWHDVFTSLARLNDPQEIRKWQENVAYLRAVRERIFSLEPRPDYVIVDFRPGSAEFAVTLIDAWVDRLVYMFSLSRDNLEYLSSMAEAVSLMDRYHEDSEDRLQVDLVLSRVPRPHGRSLTDQHGRQEHPYVRDNIAIQAACSRLRYESSQVKVLHSDASIEKRERLLFELGRKTEESQLAHEYIDLFASLIGEPQRASEYKQFLGLSPRHVETVREFRLRPGTGALINPVDNSRNVAFRIETFRRLLAGIKRAMDEPSHGTQRFDLDAALRSAGRECGVSFGAGLHRDLEGTGQKGPYSRVETWCDFDSDVGFGHFIIDHTSAEMQRGRLLSFDLYLLSSFLTAHSGDDSDHAYCGFLTGYVEGVLTKLLDAKAVVANHEPVGEDTVRTRIGESLPAGRNEPSCLFKIRIEYPQDAIASDVSDPVLAT